MEYKLIADSGSTKTDWILLCDNKRVQRYSTQGINPVMLGESQIVDILRRELSPQVGGQKVTTIEFYGAGCRGRQCDIVRNALQEVFPANRISVESDMLGAARALCGATEGVVCILGTGSNSCLYDGCGIVSNVSPLGFILGDEGSGAVLGRRLIGDLLKHQLSEDLERAFFAEYSLSLDDIIGKVYREPMPNRFLASFAPFIYKYKYRDELRNVVIDEFVRFFERNVSNYQRKDLPVHFVGSIAYYFREELHCAAGQLGYQIGKIKKAPLDD